MDNERWGLTMTPDAAVRLLEQNPDAVFEPLLQLDIAEADAPFWLGFAEEWAGALRLLDDTSRRQREAGLLAEEEWRYASRSYRLGAIVVGALHGKLREWREGDAPAARHALPMNALECYFLPAYLHDYGKMKPELKRTGAGYIEAIRAAVAAQAPIVHAVAALEAAVGRYIRELPRYAGA